MNTNVHELYLRTTKIPDWYKDEPEIDTGTLNRIYMGRVRDTRDPQRMDRRMTVIPNIKCQPTNTDK